MNHTKILFAALLLLSTRLSAQVVECDTMSLAHVDAGIVFQSAMLVTPDSSILVPMVNNTTTNFAYPQIKLVNTTPLPSGMSLYSTGWVVFASAWNVGDTATASVDYYVNTPIPDNYTVTFKLYATNFDPLTIDSCVFVNTLTINLKPVSAAAVQEVNNTQPSLSFYPNPATKQINVNAQNDTELEIYATTGALVQTTSITKSKNTVDVSGLAAGIYFLKEKGTTVVQKLVKVD